MKTLLGALLFSLLLAGTGSARPADFFIPGTHAYGGNDIPYRFFVPYEYDDTGNEDKKYPLMLTLHGGGGRGNDNWTHITYDANVAEIWAEEVQQEKNPCFVLSPQNNTATGDWLGLISLIIDLIEELRTGDGYRFDINRIYVCGISWGGRGTFHALNSTFSRPWTFAAGVPMCGSSTSSYMAHIPDDMPIWNFHSQNDNTVAVSNSRAMISAWAARGVTFRYTHCTGTGQCSNALTSAEMDALIASGENHIYTEFCCSGHALQNSAWQIPQLFDWIFSKTNDPVPPNAPTGLSADGITPYSVTLSWSAPGPASDGDTAAFYIVKRDNATIAEVYGLSYTDEGLSENTSYDYQVFASDGSNVSTTAATGTFSTTTDGAGPQVVTVIPYTLNELEMVFNEPLDETSAGTPGNYSFTGGISVSGAVLQADNKTVVLTTGTMAHKREYTISLSGIKDRAAAGNNVAAGTQVTITALQKASDTFESGSLADWTVPAAGGWAVAQDGDRALYLNSTTAEPIVLDRNYHSVVIDCDIRGSDDSNYRNLSVVFGYQDADNFYYANICNRDNNSLNGIFILEDGARTKLAAFPDGLLPDPAVYYHVRVVRNTISGDIRVYFNTPNNLIGSADDLTFNDGKNGFWSTGKTGYFDNVEVVRSRDDAFPVEGIGDIFPGSRPSYYGSIKVSPMPMKNACGISLLNYVPGKTMELTVHTQDGTVIAGNKVVSGNISWDGNTLSGTPAPGGIYYYRLTDRDGTAVTGRIIKVD